MYNQLERNIYDFFPLNRALSLQNEEDSNERKVEILRVQVDFMVNKMKEEVRIVKFSVRFMGMVYDLHLKKCTFESS